MSTSMRRELAGKNMNTKIQLLGNIHFSKWAVVRLTKYTCYHTRGHPFSNSLIELAQQHYDFTHAFKCFSL